MSPQKGPNHFHMEQIQANPPIASGSNPVAPTTPFQPNLANPELAQGELLPPKAASSDFSPQSSPKSRLISRAELRYLMSILDREIGYVGRFSDAGERAVELKDKLARIHRHGWPWGHHYETE